MHVAANGISVIICCYNSSSRLKTTLQYLAAQTGADSLQWEVVLVDNNSTDDTQKVATDFWAVAGTPVPLRIVAEKMAGLTYARAAGIKAAQYDIVLFCDDDNWLHAEYLQQIKAVFCSDKQIGITGPSSIEAVYEVEKPDWLQGHENVLCVFDTHQSQIVVHKDKPDIVHVAGAGMAVKKEILLSYLSDLDRNSGRLLLDRSPNQMLSGGDDDINILALNLGYKLLLTDKLRLQHFIPAFKLNKEYVLRLYEGMAYSMVLLNHFHGQRPDKAQGWNVGGMIKYIILNAIKNPFNNSILMRTIRGRRRARNYLQLLLQQKAA